MAESSRRHFLTIGGTSVAGLSCFGGLALATPLSLPLGIQLYSVRQQMKEDLDGTLRAISEAGYTEVEAAALPAKSAKDIRAGLDRARLRCVSAHHSLADLRTRLDEIVAYDLQLGVANIICASPQTRVPPAPGTTSGKTLLSLDDWQYDAEQLNLIGEKTAAHGLQFGYHNHVAEFFETDGKLPYIELLTLTDPKKVTFELDCGWAVVAHMSPVQIMKNHSHRISMLHIKDFKAPIPVSADTRDAKVTELGVGFIDYRPIFAEAAKTQHVLHAFVEQESFDMPWQQSLKVDADYMRRL